MPIASMTGATLDDLARVDEKAELIGGRIVYLMPSGYLPGKIARRITRSLEDDVAAGGVGEPVGDTVGYGFHVPLPSGRQSFSPDSSLFTGPLPGNLMRFIEDSAPAFAVEVRSENDYGMAKDQEYRLKRKDYFFAGTLVVWDVDPVAETVTAYKTDAPSTPTIYHVGDIADAEPAVPGWRIAVADIFE